MWRRFSVGFGAAAVLALGAAPAAAAPSPPPDGQYVDGAGHGRPGGGHALQTARFYADRLRGDPVYVTGNAPDLIPQDAAAQIKGIIGGLGVPVYVVVALSPAAVDAPESLVPLIHDQLGRPGIYIVAGPRGG